MSLNHLNQYFGLQFGLIAAMAVVIATVATGVYWFIYKHKINKRLLVLDQTLRSCRLIPPWAFYIITIFVLFIAIAGLAAYMVLTPGSGADRIPAEYRGGIYEFQAYRPSQMTGSRSHFSIYENAEFTKTVQQHGDIRFTIFIREEAFSHFHPSFIIYAEYTGDKDILYYGERGLFITPDGTELSGMGASGSSREYEGYICVIGTSDKRVSFELTIALYDSEVDSSDREVYIANITKDLLFYSTTRETVTIEMPNQ